MQRLFDLVISGLSILVLSPLLLPIILLLRITGEGEVFFSQERMGKGGSLFSLHKFATMLKDSPNIGSGTLTVQNDPRILPLGKCLRKTKINELPQLVNVFKGDMSIVGPRPQSSRNFSAFSEDVQKNIMLVSPGLTGLGSIFFSDEEAMLTSSVNNDELQQYSDHVLYIPDTHKFLSPILKSIPLQLLAYHIAVMKGCNVDQPRNLAKSVTVE